ncbi:metal-dependent hydrolase [Sphingomonas sp. MG17]|uniref:Metal-dependent hydrolase n=1 Tax=Sphingomonas tagetis TaxID=2949092 RepID=A0A9X2HHV4_9SPHN|nr:metal-dependent hydrolase [Sphingomonas tagetis]MCP3730202.1 metal-dependent hydrolase [Sphingomonas tagetis]
MDNLTHSLIGALIGQTGLKKLSGLAMPTLIVAANIPDLDAACSVYGTQSLAMRRGLTHGPVAMAVLPLLLTAIMVGFDRWQTRRGKRPAARPPVRPLHLLLLAYVGTLSHPAFDWLNNYGIRLLEPFSSRWFYGDSIFIIDLWIWAMLIGGLIWSWRAERQGGDWARRGSIVAVVLSAYIFGNGVTTGVAEARTAQWVRTTYGIEPELVVASPVPIAFWQREMLWRGGGQHGRRDLNLAGGWLPTLVGQATAGPVPIGMDDPRIVMAVRTDPDARAFLFWSRMPFAQPQPDGSIVLRDQRFGNPLVGDRFSVRIAPGLRSADRGE